MCLKILLGLLLLPIIAPINGEINYLQTQLNHFLTRDSLYPAIPLSVGVVHCGKFKETDFVNNCLKNRHFATQPVIIYCNQHLINETLKFSHVLMFVTGDLFKHFQVFYQQGSLWTSQTRFTFIFLRDEDDNLMKQVQKEFWNRFQVLNYIFVYVTGNGTFIVQSYNPFNSFFKNFVNDSDLFEDKLQDLHGYKIKAVLSRSVITNLTQGIIPDDNKLFGYFVAQYLNLTLELIVCDRYNYQIHADVMNKGQVDLDLNVGNISNVEYGFGIAYNGPLITLLRKPSQYFRFDMYKVFDLHVWFLFGVSFLILNICKLIALKSKHFPNIFAIDQVVLTFCFVNFSQTVLTSVLALPLTQTYMETIKDLMKNNITIYMSPNTVAFISERVDRRNIKVIAMADNFNKILDRQLMHKEAVVFWPMSFEKMKEASPKTIDNYYLLKEAIGILSYGRHLKYPAPLKEGFERAFVRFKETCFSPIFCVHVKVRMQNEHLNFHTLTVYDILHVFNVLFAGLGCGLICFLSEIIVFQLHNIKCLLHFFKN
ncbi:hypothetical protein ABEB36_012175 [Hypothenemus hampei]|uniref:Ionotropic receptor n=1 Tax=Hypothenemus hampei TaxID=57062 RepID=A0ABD1EAD4_HYPHA